MASFAKNGIRNNPLCRLLAIIILLAGIAGCSFKQKIARNALDYNQSMESTNNNLMLLNILRATDKKPLYFSRLGSVTGNLTSEVTGEASASITSSSKSTNTFGVTSAGTYASSPTFNIQNLESQEFYDKILRPIGPEIFELFWHQGWPKQLLLHLFVRKILVVKGEYKIEGTTKLLLCYVDNDPYDLEKFKIFQIVVEQFLDDDPMIKIDRPKFGIPMSGFTARDLIEAKKADLSVEEANGKLELRDARNATLKVHDLLDTDQGQRRKADKRRLYADIELEDRRSTGACTTQDIKSGLVITGSDVLLRSPSSMMYYLGEVVRYQLEKERNANYTPITIGYGPEEKQGKVRFKAKEPFFRVVTHPSESLEIVVSYQGETFGVPEEQRTLETLALIHQVFAFFTSVKDLPATTTFRITG